MIPTKRRQLIDGAIRHRGIMETPGKNYMRSWPFGFEHALAPVLYARGANLGSLVVNFRVARRLCDGGDAEGDRPRYRGPGV